MSTAFATLITMLALHLAVATEGAPAQADVAAVATLIADADIGAVIEAAPNGRVSDVQFRMVDAGGYNVGVGVVLRPASAPGGAIEHDKQTEVYRVVSGSGTLVTGGELVDRRQLPPDGNVVKQLTGPSSFGSAIRGGESRQISAGDIVIIPAGVAHGFSELQEDITYLVIRIDPEQLVQLK